MTPATTSSYSWRPDARRSADPQVVGEALEKLRGDGLLLPERIVTTARAEKSPLHPLFEWDDARAAHRYRLEQARHVVQDLRATVVTQEGEVRENVRAYVNVIVGQEQGYVPMLRVMGDRDLARQTVAAALDDLNRWRRRYAELVELGTLFEVIDGLAAELAETALTASRSFDPKPAAPRRVRVQA